MFQELDIKNKAKEKLTSINTDGENSNTDIKSGLWVCMKRYLIFGASPVG